MQKETSIRVGTPADVHDVMELALSACGENGFVNPNPERLLAEIWPALNLDKGLIGIIGEENQKPEAAVLLRVGTMWYSDDAVLEEKAIFVHPEYRSAKGGRARRLCEFSKQVSDKLGIPLIIGVLSNHRTEAKVRLYERQFGKPSGAFFLYNAKTGHLQAAAE
jgi:GNAT superfamily N-acetyltransferase